MLLLVTMQIGCSQWKQTWGLESEKKKSPFGFAQNRLPVDAVELQLIVAKIDPRDVELEKQAWSELDQQAIDLDVRKRLAANGIRCGVSTARLPLSLQNLIQHHAQSREADATNAESLVGEETLEQIMQVRAGHPSHIIMSPTFPRLAWIVDDEGYLYGDDNRQARCQFTLKTRPTSNNLVRIEMIPEITFGDTRQQIGVGNSALVYEMAQDRHILTPLAVDAELAEGQWLVIGNAESPSGIGQTFLKEPEEAGGRRKLILLRISKLSTDELFSPNSHRRAIATPTD
jgi:hypothetical protein